MFKEYSDGVDADPSRCSTVFTNSGFGGIVVLSFVFGWAFCCIRVSTFSMQPTTLAYSLQLRTTPVHVHVRPSNPNSFLKLIHAFYHFVGTDLQCNRMFVQDGII